MKIRFVDSTFIWVSDYDSQQAVYKAIEQKDKWVEIFYPHTIINLDNVITVRSEEYIGGESNESN